MERNDDTAVATTPRVTTVRVVYLARLREVLGCASETIELRSAAAPAVRDLIDALRARGDPWAHELGAGKVVRYAVNQRLAQPDAVVAEDDEVAVFPPVTGG